jgi:hypothetical protein
MNTVGSAAGGTARGFYWWTPPHAHG